MKKLAYFLFPSALFAGYTYYYSDPLTSINSNNWYQNGSVTATSGGLTATSSNGGSLISSVAVPDGTGQYEVKTTLALTASGGTYVTYLDATSNALSGPASQGTYYAIELQNPTFSGSSCQANLVIYKSVSQSVTQLSSKAVSCHNGMVLRVTRTYGWFGPTYGYQIMVFIDNLFSDWVPDSSLTTGQPGVGARGTPSGNSIAGVALGPLDRIGPNPFNSSEVGTSSFANRVDVQSPGVSDDTNGPGIAWYQFYRNGVQLGAALTPTFSDETVSPSTTYTYQIVALDYDLNGTSVTFTVTTPPTGSVDPRRIGIRPTGAYWGANPEQIDLLSGNLNFSLPLLKALGRGGWGVPFALSYNAQNLRQDSGGTWNMGRDVGYGYGWQLLAGSITPYWSGGFTLDHYVFTDASGAQYRLNQNNNGIWSSSESVYVWFDQNASILHFRDGSFWTMMCNSYGTEQDAGTLYPTTMEDTNGNQINIVYYHGIGAVNSDTSARIAWIEDVRAVSQSGTYETYNLTYNTDPIPHLTSLTNYISTGEAYTFSYAENQSLSSPINSQSLGTTTFLGSVTVANNLNATHLFQFDSGGEMTKVTLPYGGYIRWVYGNFTYTASRIQREVQSRYISADGSTEIGPYTISHESDDGNHTIHASATVGDPGGVGSKAWTFSQSGANLGLATLYQGQQLPGPVTKTQDSFTWSQDANGNNYLSSNYTTLDPGQSYSATKATYQLVDIYGNVTQLQNFNYGAPGSGNIGTLARAYVYSYLNSSAYTARYIYNRLTQATVTDGTSNLTLASNSYDTNGGIGPCFYGGIYTTNGLREWDSAYPATFTTRGNVGIATTPNGYTCYIYDQAGNTLGINVNGVITQVSTSSATNFAAPTQLTVGSLTTNLGWSSFLGLSNETGPNGDSASILYDQYARKSGTASPFGAGTSYIYSSFTNPPSTGQTAKTITTDTDTPTPPSSGRWTLSTLDGFGRTILSQSADSSNTVKSQAESIYGPCACSPLGKLTQQAMPHVVGGNQFWTVYRYDGIGRTLSVVSPDGASTTTYSYQGNNVTVTDPAGKWKTFTMDALGNLIQVLEPDPAHPTTSTYTTAYGFDLLNNLTSVSMPRPTGTQTRAFAYNGKNLMWAQNPENGTVTYTYNQYSKVASKTDAKGQAVVYSYDSYARLTKVQRYPAATGTQTNLSLSGVASESSVYAPSTVASKANDGNTDGNYNDGSVSHTNNDTNAWWQVDLGNPATINSIAIWNRTDCCGSRLSDYWVFISDTPFLASDTPATLQYRAGVWSNHQTVMPNPTTTINTGGAQGRYVRVQLSGTNYLALAEVQVFGVALPSGGLTEDTCQQENYYYDTNPFDSSYSQYTAGRLAAVQYYGPNYYPNNAANPSPYNNASSSCTTTFTEMYTYTQAGGRAGKRLRVTRTVSGNTTNVDLNATFTYDSEGRTTGAQYPLSGPNLNWTYDTMGRLNTMGDGVNPGDIMSAATYGPSSELLSLTGMVSETRTYNSLLQLTQLVAGGSSNITYSYSATQNNGKITSQTDNLSGEQVVYTYDALNRLASAQSTSNSWGQSYTYDGFGNLTDQNVIAGSAPTYHVVPDPATNHLGSTDANGNTLGTEINSPYASYGYDVENRFSGAGPFTTGSFYYSYAPGNKRVWRGVCCSTDPYSGDTVLTTDEVVFWSPGGQKLATYQLAYSGTTTLTATQTATWYYFGGKMIKNAGGYVGADRLGSIGHFYPYGQEKPSATQNGTEKFTGYLRDAETGMDYADQRYHYPGTGRFLTSDRYHANGGAGGDLTDPGTWNRYSYTSDDPINRIDPIGEEWCDPLESCRELPLPECDPLEPATCLPACVAEPGICAPLGGGGGTGGGGTGGGSGFVQGKPIGYNGVYLDLSKVACYGLLGFQSGKAAQSYLQGIKFQVVHLGVLQVSTTSSGSVTINSGTPPPAQDVNGSTIQLNYDYNWIDFSDVRDHNTTTGANGTFDYLGAINASLGTNMNSAQLAQLIIIHELLHALGAPQESDFNAFNTPIYNDCIKQ